MKNISKTINSYRDEILEDVIGLVRIQSVRSSAKEGMPFGEGPANALDYCITLAKNMGLKVKNVDGRAVHIEYGEGEGLIGILVHCDVVPAGEGWSMHPFGGEVVDGRIYGRGTMDDKGPAIAALYCLKALRDLKIETHRRIRVIIGASEESGMEDMEYYFAHEEMPDLAFSPDGEYPICNREKGILHIGFECAHNSKQLLEFESGNAANIVPFSAQANVKYEDFGVFENAAQTLEADGAQFAVVNSNGTVKLSCFGKSAHASTPEDGVNAATRLIRLLKQTLGGDVGMLLNFLDATVGISFDGAEMGVACEDKESGALTLNVGIVRVENGRDRALIDIRYPVTMDGAEIYKKIEEKAEKFGVRSSIISDSKPLFVAEDSTLIEKLKHAYTMVTGKKGETYSMGGGSYARVLGNRGVAFGAGFKPLSYYNIHGADEFLDIDDFMEHCGICLQAIYELACD